MPTPIETTKLKPWRWRKKQSVGWRSPEAHELTRGGVVFATVQRRGNAWFWYGPGLNTAARPASLDECKAEAAAHVKETEAAGND